jgi:Curli production assembly/transport component CsgG
MKQFIIIFAFILAVQAEKISVVNIRTDNQLFVSAFTTKLQVELVNRGYTVIERDRLETILQQQGLRLSGLIDSDKMPQIADVDKLITGTVASLNDSTHYVALKLIDVNLGITLKADYFTVNGPLENVINTSSYAIKRLFQTNQYKQYEPKVTETTVSVQIPQKTKPIFVPCSYCQGRGILQNGKDCPYCDASYHYEGIETHYQSLTGNWR